MSRKKKRSALFDIDTVKEKIEEKCCVANVKEQVGNLQKFNVCKIFLSKGLTFTEDETLQLLAAQPTFQGVCNLRKAIQHVPSNIVRITAGKSLRASLIWDAFTAFCASNSNISINLDVDELSCYTQIMERWCPTFLSVNDGQMNLRKNKSASDMFISPPVASCKCDKALTMHNNPSAAMLFTLEGPMHCSKVTLECRNCAVCFGPCNYSDDCGMHLYSADISSIVQPVLRANPAPRVGRVDFTLKCRILRGVHAVRTRRRR